MEKRSSIRKNTFELWILIVALIISLPLIFSMFEHRVIHGDDLFFHAGRIRSIALELPNQFPVYMCRDWLSGLGVPAATFYPSIFLYIPAIICKLGLSIETVYTGFLIALVFFSAMISFAGFRKFFDEKTAAVISTIYISQSYFLFDLYHRAAVGEILGMMFLPLAIASLKNFSEQDKFKTVKTILIFSCIIESHILSALILAGIILLYTVWNFRSIVWKKYFKIFIGTILLNAFFIVPFLYQYQAVDVWIKYIVQEPISADVWNHLTRPILATEVVIFIGGICFYCEKIFWQSFFITAVMLLISLEFFHLDLIVRLFQFQWRAFMIYSIFSAVCLGLLLTKIFVREKFLIAACVFNAFIAMFYWQSGLKYTQLTDENFRTGLNYIDYAYHDISIDQFFKWQSEGLPNDGKTLPILFYEGYEVRDSTGHILQIKPSSQHLIEVESGSIENVSVNYKGLTIFKLAFIISVATAIIFFKELI